MTAATVPSEIEVKLEAPSAKVLRHLARLRMFGRFRLRPRRAQRLHSVYLDTADFALARAGVALRLRRHAGRWEATAKWAGRVVGPLHERPELTVALRGAPPVPFVLPEGTLRQHLAPFVLGRPLQPILVTDIHRSLRDVLPPRGGAAPLAELALDTVSLQQPGGAPTAAYWEVEIELRGGRRRVLRDLGRALQQRFALAPSRASKFARGVASVYGAGAPQVAATVVGAGDTVAVAARRIVAAQLARLRACDPGTRGGREPEALHQMRVATRRLRAVMRLFAAAVPARQHETLTRELRWLAEELGRVRDLDVQLVRLGAPAQQEAAAEDAALAGLRRHLARERARQRRALLASLDSPRYIRLLRSLERFAFAASPKRPPRGEAGVPVAAFGRKAIKRAVRRLLARGRAIGDVPEADDLHALRIRAKRLRYVLDALRPLSGRPGRRLAKPLARLQDVLGRFNDAVVAAAFIRAYHDGAGAREDEHARLALTALADAELRRAGTAQADFQRTWRRFAAKSTLREYRALLEMLKASADD